MSKYIVTVSSASWERVEVEADSEAEAEEIALRESRLEAPIMDEIQEL